MDEANSEEVSCELRSGVVALIGPANVGKSTLFNALIGQKLSLVSSKKQSTRNRILGVKTDALGQVLYLDTPGFGAEKYKGALSKFLSKVYSRSVEEADLTILLIDAPLAQRNDSHIKELLLHVRKFLPQGATALVFNKLDRIKPGVILPLMQKAAATAAEVFGKSKVKDLEIFPICALKGEGIQELHDFVRGSLPQGPKFFEDGVLTDQPEDFLVAEIIREQLILQLSDELPYSLAVKVESWVEGDKMDTIHAVIYVERTSQKGIVISKGGAKLKKVGTAARQEIEKMFGVHVNLKLFVKVESNWTKTFQGIARAGYSAEDRY